MERRYRRPHHHFHRHCLHRLEYAARYDFRQYYCRMMCHKRGRKTMPPKNSPLHLHTMA